MNKNLKTIQPNPNLKNQSNLSSSRNKGSHGSAKIDNTDTKKCKSIYSEKTSYSNSSGKKLKLITFDQKKFNLIYNTRRENCRCLKKTLENNNLRHHTSGTNNFNSFIKNSRSMRMNNSNIKSTVCRRNIKNFNREIQKNKFISPIKPPYLKQKNYESPIYKAQIPKIVETKMQELIEKCSNLEKENEYLKSKIINPNMRHLQVFKISSEVHNESSESRSNLLTRDSLDNRQKSPSPNNDDKYYKNLCDELNKKLEELEKKYKEELAKNIEIEENCKTKIEILQANINESSRVNSEFMKNNSKIAAELKNNLEKLEKVEKENKQNFDKWSQENKILIEKIECLEKLVNEKRNPLNEIEIERVRELERYSEHIKRELIETKKELKHWQTGVKEGEKIEAAEIKKMLDEVLEERNDLKLRLEKALIS